MTSSILSELHAIDFHQLLRIYLAAPRTEGELFLHSWYQAGRTNFLHHRQHLEASPIQDLVAGNYLFICLSPPIPFYHATTDFLFPHLSLSYYASLYLFLIGTAAGVALTIVGHPFDTVKVRIQTTPRFKSATDVVWQTVRKEGPLALFKGMASPMATIPAINAVVFASYAQGRDFLTRFNKEGEDLKLWQITLAGAYSGTFNVIHKIVQTVHMA